jgi:hypothetical protein
MKKEILIVVTVLGLAACNDKKKDPTPAPEEPAPAVVCFNTNNNGTYTAAIGAIQSGSSVTSFTGGVVTINRTSCQEVSITLSSSAGNKSESVKNVTLNSNSVYEGNVSTGNITMAFGSHINANAPGSFTVIANK